eukprot:Platyproteum_vivax@DN10336_c0_g1_i1.p1
MAELLQQPPEDSISRLRYSTAADKSLLVVSSWDSKVRVYNLANPQQPVMAVQEASHPVLDCTFGADSNTVLSGGLSQEVTSFDVETGTAFPLGSHSAGVRCVNFHPELNLTFSGGWDAAVHTWDSRQAGSSQGQVKLNGKVFCMAVGGKHLVTGDSTKAVSIYDVRRLDEPVEVRDQILKYQLRSLEIFPNGNGFALSSIEGRVAWEFFDETAGKKYAFKCHREKDGDMEKVFPVNCLSFHPVHGTFATGGSDGTVSVWDGYSMKRLWRMSAFLTSVTSVAFSLDGRQLAIGVSYDFSQGPQELTPPCQIAVKELKEEDVRPKQQLAV